jgi:serine/threonine protein kinase
MLEQESQLKVDISPGAMSLPPDVHAVGETRLLSLISNHSAESDVWIGERANGERVAVKIYRHGRIPGLVAESQKCTLNHPHLVPVIEAGEIEGRYFEISPYIPGGTLADFCQHRGRLSESEAETILTQISEVVHYLHGQHVLHRDIKPGNIFVLQEAPLRVALADFGTARLGAYQTMLTGSVGTIAYSSPEAVTGIQSEAADYWSLGTVLLEVLTGRRPLEGLDIKQQLYRVASGKIEIPEAIPTRWKTLFEGLLRSDYTERWRKKEIELWLRTPGIGSIIGERTEPIAQSVQPRRPQPADSEPGESKVSPENRRSFRSAGENGVLSRSTVPLVREPEAITLTVSDLGELVFNRALRTFGRFFWLAFLVDWQSHNAWPGILLLAIAAAAGIGIDFLPSRLEQLKREVRVNRQLATFSREDQRFLRRLVRSWMRSLRRSARDEGSSRGRRISLAARP